MKPPRFDPRKKVIHDSIKATHKKCITQELDNTGDALRHGHLDHLKDIAHGLDGVVIGAGPSLENGFDMLKQCNGRTLLCAALQALPTLYAGGVKPDLVMLIDQEEAHHHIYEKIPPEWLANITMIYLVCAHKGVIDRYPGTKIPCWTDGGVARTLFPEAFAINPEGNVAVALTKILHFFGLSRIFFVGQDFGWTDDKSHASGHHAADANIRHETFNIKFGKEEISGKTTTQLVAAWQSLRGYISQNKMPAFNLYGGGGSRYLKQKQWTMNRCCTCFPMQQMNGSPVFCAFSPPANPWRNSDTDLRERNCCVTCAKTYNGWKNMDSL